MKNYDGWCVKGEKGLLLFSLRERRSEVIDWWDSEVITKPYKWKNWSKKRPHKIVKVKLQEVSDK